MKQYTVTALAKSIVAIPDPIIMLGPGSNVFSVFTNDPEGVKQLLEDEGVEVLSFELIETPPTTAADILLPGEPPEEVFGVFPDPESEEISS